MGKDLEKNDDYKEFIKLLTQQYQTKENFTGILESAADEANEIESAIFEVRDEYYLSTAVGVQLDNIGDILGLTRDGRDDESYRTLLEIKAEINLSAGTPESLIKTASAIYNAENVEYTPLYPAKVQLWTDGDIGIYLFFNAELDDGGLLELDDGGILQFQQPDEIAEDLLFSVLPAGVGMLLADNLILDDSEFLYLDDGGQLILTSE